MVVGIYYYYKKITKLNLVNLNDQSNQRYKFFN